MQVSYPSRSDRQIRPRQMPRGDTFADMYLRVLAALARAIDRGDERLAACFAATLARHRGRIR